MRRLRIVRERSHLVSVFLALLNSDRGKQPPLTHRMIKCPRLDRTPAWRLVPNQRDPD